MLVTSGRVYDLAAYLHRGECQLCYVGESRATDSICDGTRRVPEARNATPRIFPIREFRPRRFWSLKGRHRRGGGQILVSSSISSIPHRFNDSEVYTYKLWNQLFNDKNNTTMVITS